MDTVVKREQGVLMPITNVRVAALLAVLCGSLASCRDGTSNERMETMSESTSVSNQVELTAELPQRLVVNDRWPVELTLHNSGHDAVTVTLLRDATKSVTLVARSAAGERIQPTSFAEQSHRHIEGAPFVSVSAFLIRIEPGESHKWTIDLDKCFKFAPGEYTVEISVPVEPVGIVRDEVRVNILARQR